MGNSRSCISMILLPISDNLVNLPMFITALFTLIAMSTYRLPAVALMPDVTLSLRSKANAVINLMGALGQLILALISFLVPDVGKPNYSDLLL